MSEEVKTALVELLKQMTSLASDGMTLARDQFPLVLQDLILRGRISITFFF